MRLSKNQKKVILEASESSFGDANIILFGSRVDDSKRGGDFDLPIGLVLYTTSSRLLQQEIDKGIKINMA